MKAKNGKVPSNLRTFGGMTVDKARHIAEDANLLERGG